MNAVMDEIGEIVRDNITTPKEARRIKALADDFLPCERMGDQWPQNIAADIDLELATEFTIINLNAILRLLHPKKFRGVPAPRFASFNAFKDSVCVIHVDKIKDTAHKFDVTLLIQEVVEWSAQVERIADPLVIGVKNGVHYLIDRFDTTTLEEYVAREFSA